jgi:broad specificity phosphatase PhoE
VTGQIIAESLGLTTTEPLTGLNDVDYGQWQGLTVEEVKAHWAEEFEKWSRTPHLAEFPRGETLQGVLARVSRVLRDLLRQHPRDTVVLVGHNSVNRVILLRALDLPLSRYRCLTQDHCAISELDFSNGSFRVKSLNETFHLQAARLAWPRSSGKDSARQEGSMPDAQCG